MAQEGFKLPTHWVHEDDCVLSERGCETCLRIQQIKDKMTKNLIAAERQHADGH